MQQNNDITESVKNITHAIPAHIKHSSFPLSANPSPIVAKNIIKPANNTTPSKLAIHSL